MEASRQPFKLQNPFVLRVGQVMTGFGLGCGLGIGVGVPIPMDIPGVAQVMGAANGMTRHIGGGRQLQGLIKRVGIKNLEAGIGCGVGLGHGFGIGLALKPGVSQQILHMLQEGCSTVLNKVRPQAHEGPHNEAPGVPDSGAHESAVRPFQSPFTSPLNQLASTPSIKNSKTEMEELRTQNEILRTLLRHQERIEDLEHENALLRERLNMNGITRSPASRALNSRQTSTDCFDCRSLARRRK
ncbi:hypothetical protein M758_5G049000 [Ceratodon purpureus]|uniref:Uncharacterized protein n=1 Tax=Ceratodon purpureus TaxID=3225 RepID=A0A8T0HYT6_CERPU|nr:hypothetical protein KC19_5G050000 [Ceratodon purpureus]KAG0615533.1 hypothetical protein M758_5G049000 [Ceratodon purpureus]